MGYKNIFRNIKNICLPGVLQRRGCQPDDGCPARGQHGGPAGPDHEQRGRGHAGGGGAARRALLATPRHVERVLLPPVTQTRQLSRHGIN